MIVTLPEGQRDITTRSADDCRTPFGPRACRFATGGASRRHITTQSADEIFDYVCYAISQCEALLFQEPLQEPDKNSPQ
jgi:hypothetical protein